MPRQEQKCYGCIFCVTGKEELVAQNIRGACTEVQAITARLEKYKSDHGKKCSVQALAFPNYVFFATRDPGYPVARFPQDGICRVLKSATGDWRLTGEDGSFARWLFTYNGVLRFSQAYRADDRIIISSGPLKDLEGKICRIDKRGRSGQVALNFNGRSIRVWLGFELLEDGCGDRQPRFYTSEKTVNVDAHQRVAIWGKERNDNP